MKTSAQLVEEAEREIETLSVGAAIALSGDADVQFIDLREKGELRRDGLIPGAFHAPRGLLEFWVDPESEYYAKVFGSDKKFVFFCAAGWRSALATKAVQDMGLENVCHIEGGFGAWKEAGGPIQEPKPRS